MALIHGIHHITAIASDAQRNVDFYTGVLGLRMVKKTVNFDAPDVYHLYYGNEIGSPGTVLTFFPFPGATRGRPGAGQVTHVAFSIPSGALDYWMRRLEQLGIAYRGPERRFDESVIAFEDEDGLGLELVANDRDDRVPFIDGQIPAEVAVRGFYGATLAERRAEKTERLLQQHMDHALVAQAGNRFRYMTNGRAGGFIDIVLDDERGVPGSGTVHHIAFSVTGDKEQLVVREKLLGAGLDVTPVIDRSYFHSVYFREPGGVLFEIATMAPGFLIDEPKEALGERLSLPPWQEGRRAIIEKELPPIQVRRGV